MSIRHKYNKKKKKKKKKRNYTKNWNWACLVRYLKIINIVWKTISRDIGILGYIVSGTQNGNNSSRSSCFWELIKAILCILWSRTTRLPIDKKDVLYWANESDLKEREYLSSLWLQLGLDNSPLGALPSPLRGNCTPNQNWACYLKNVTVFFFVCFVLFCFCFFLKLYKYHEAWH